jgi:hypothetical protein
METSSAEAATAHPGRIAAGWSVSGHGLTLENTQSAIAGRAFRLGGPQRASVICSLQRRHLEL